MHTIYTGAPYGIGGEAGPDVASLEEAAALASRTLHTIDQHLIVIDDGSSDAIARYGISGRID